MMLSRPAPPVALVRAFFLVCPARSTAASSTGFSGRSKFFLARGPILPRVRYSGASFADRAASGFPLHNPCPAATRMNMTGNPLVWIGLAGVEDDDTPRARAWQQRLHGVMIGIALLALPAYLLD